MKHYVITIQDNKNSKAAAGRCIASGQLHGLAIHEWKATTPRDDLDWIVQRNSIQIEGFVEKWSRNKNALAAFLSHFSLWQECIMSNQEITIFEHDAIVVNNIPTLIPYQGCISLGAPSYGKYETPFKLGVNPLTSKPYFPGAHAYRINPNGANILISTAKANAKPTDVFLDIRTFPFLEEYYPWPVEARDTFTTIQNELGCKAKHNYNEQYEIVDA